MAAKVKECIGQGLFITWNRLECFFMMIFSFAWVRKGLSWLTWFKILITETLFCLFSDWSKFVSEQLTIKVLFSADGEKFKFPEENPFIVDEDDEESEDKNSPVASVGYRYRKWDLGNDVKLVARCEHDAVVQVWGK